MKFITSAPELIVKGYKQVGMKFFRILTAILRRNHSQMRLHLQYQLEKGI